MKPFHYLLALSALFGLTACGTVRPLTGPTATSVSLVQTEQAPIPAKLAVGKDDPIIAKTAARLLVGSHYLQKDLTSDTSVKLFNRYLDALDPQHFYFLQSDVEEFAPTKEQLCDLIQQKGDTSIANRIFARFLERFDQQKDYVKAALEKEQFAFDTEENYSLDRKKAPRPKDMEEAKHLWRDRLRYEYLQERLNKQKPEDIVKKINKRYSNIWHNLHQQDGDDVLQLYLTSLMNVYDPHSDYMGKALMANFGIQMKLSLFGIGALLTSDDGYCKIQELTPGGPAVKSGLLKPGDRIVAVAQGEGEWVDVVDMKLDKVVEMIRGPKGTKIRLRVIPVDAADPATRKTIALIRDEVKLEDKEAKANLIEVPTGPNKTMRLGVIDLPSFYSDMDSDAPGGKSTTVDVLRLLRKLKLEKVNGVILDLRRNGGGSLTEAINLTGLFIKGGPVVQVRSADKSVRVDDDEDPGIAYDGPLIVLTSRFSASASEILAGALQDYGRALIVGDSSTHGKGTVQTLVRLAPFLARQGKEVSGDPGAIKLTIQKFYRASGSSTQLKGIVPDIVLPSLNELIESGEKSLDYPLAWDTIPAASYTSLNRVRPYLADLKKRSGARIATDKDFLYQQQEAQRLKPLMQQKVVSLNEQQRLKEKQEAEARSQARKKELQARPASKEKVYVITLKQASAPGLPAPLDLKKEATKPKLTGDDEDGDATTPANDPMPALDITLEEAKHILLDYIALANKGGVALKR